MQQELAEDIGGGVGFAAGREELGKVGEVVARGDEGEFVNAPGTDLREADGGRESVADALAAEGLLGGATFAEIIPEGFGGTAVADGAVRFAIEVAEVAQVADAAACLIVGGVGKGGLELGRL